MKDWPTQPSILTWKLLTMTHGLGPRNCFLTTGTTITRPGLRPTLSTPAIGATTSGSTSPGTPVTGPVTPGVMPAVPPIVTPSDVLMSMPQPIS